jgi:hypothetical protein
MPSKWNLVLALYGHVTSGVQRPLLGGKRELGAGERLDKKVRQVDGVGISVGGGVANVEDFNHGETEVGSGSALGGGGPVILQVDLPVIFQNIGHVEQAADGHVAELLRAAGIADHDLVVGQ